jgi:transcriptional regulator with XRE-family HTH domain
VTPVERFGRNLFMARRRAGLAQGELARRVSMQQNDLSLLERGRRRPRLDTLVRLARGLEMPAGDLLRGID